MDRIDRETALGDSPDPTVDLIAASLTHAVRRARDRYLAIFELQLEACRQPTLREALAGLAGMSAAFTTAEHAKLGPRRPARRGADADRIHGGALLTLVADPTTPTPSPSAAWPPRSSPARDRERFRDHYQVELRLAGAQHRAGKQPPVQLGRSPQLRAVLLPGCAAASDLDAAGAQAGQLAEAPPGTRGCAGRLHRAEGPVPGFHQDIPRRPPDQRERSGSTPPRQLAGERLG